MDDYLSYLIFKTTVSSPLSYLGVVKVEGEQFIAKPRSLITCLCSSFQPRIFPDFPFPKTGILTRAFGQSSPILISYVWVNLFIVSIYQRP
jgi:hypothetical protein